MFTCAPPLSDKVLQTILDRLAGEESFVFLETTRVTKENHRSLLFLNPVDRLVITASDPPSLFFKQVETYLNDGFYLAGWVAYEFGYRLEPVLDRRFTHDPLTVLADFGVFREPRIFDMFNLHNSACPEMQPDADSSPGQNLNPESSPEFSDEYRLDNLRLNQEKHDYLKKIQTIKSYITAGDTYQVNYTLKLLFDFFGSHEAFYKTLRRNQNVSYGAYIKSLNRRIMSFSPELFFNRHGSLCTARPMKGTLHRGLTPEEDQKLTLRLENDLKNRSENVMIVDLLRNDLGRLCEAGSVSVKSLFDVETYETLHQMTSTIVGKFKPGVSLKEMFSALFPCGSVTGAPKIRTMEIIRELELEKRGVYTGGIGYIAPSGDALFNVPIRTVVIEDGRGEMGIGSGIVHDSDPENEWDECRLKARFLDSPLPDFQLIETMLWQPDGGYLLLDLHIERLIGSARHLGFPADPVKIVERLELLSRSFFVEHRDLSSREMGRRVRLLLHKDGTIDLTSAMCPLPDLNFPPDNRSLQEGLPKVAFSKKTTDSNFMFLYHKTTIREIYNKEREKAVAQGFYDVLFLNQKGEVTEGSITNIFIRRKDLFITPPLTCGLLNGTLRKFLLEKYPAGTKEAVLYPDDLKNADGVYLTNSVRGMQQVQYKKAAPFK